MAPSMVVMKDCRDLRGMLLLGVELVQVGALHLFHDDVTGVIGVECGQYPYYIRVVRQVDEGGGLLLEIFHRPVEQFYLVGVGVHRFPIG